MTFSLLSIMTPRNPVFYFSAMQKGIGSLIVFILLAGCAKEPFYVPMPESIKHQIQSTDVVFLENSEPLSAEIESSNLQVYAGGGLLFALVDSAIVGYRASKAEEQIDTMKKSLEGYDFHGHIQDVIAPTLLSCDALGLNTPKRNFLENGQSKYKEKIIACIQEAQSDAVMTILYKHQFNPDFSVLTGSLQVEIHPVNDKISALIKDRDFESPAIYRNLFKSSYPLKGATDEREDNTNLWLADDAASLRMAFAKTLDNIRQKFTWSLGNTHIVPEN